MCGFAGFFGFKNSYPEKSGRLNLLHQMALPISRRGPDDEQLYDDGVLSFAFRRLSIVDVQNGQQPIWNEDESLFVSINGEIYNHRELKKCLKGEHRFRTNSDSEIVLHLYEEMGPKCLDLLIGMFAIVIWDKNKQELFIARDRLGIKPLYFCQLKEGFIFGSELKALLPFPLCPREVDWKTFRLGLSGIGQLQDNNVSTFIKGINFLPGGSYAIYNKAQGLVEKRYWDIESYYSKTGDKILSSQSYVDEYARLIEDSVNKRLMSDVPIGSFLSGGLDSALVTAIAARKNKDIHCFHAMEQTTLLCGDSAAARQLASLNGVPFHSVLFDSKKFIKDINFSLNTFEYLIWVMDSPHFDFEILLKHELHRYAKTKIPDLKVMLLGQGSDEFAGGYSNTNGLTKNWDTFASVGLKNEALWEWFESNEIPLGMRSLLSKDTLLGANTPRSNFQKMVHGRVKLLQGYNLWHEDRTSSAQGVESRVPFLDHRLVEFLVSIPSELHQELFWDKTIVRRAAENWIPKELANRPKIGFYQTRNQTSIWDLKRDLITCIFPEFSDKYLKQSSSVFSGTAIEEIFNATQVMDSTSWQSIDALITYMGMACFIEICKSQNHNYLSTLTPPSPLIEVKEGKAEKIWNINEWNLQQASWGSAPRRWKDSDCPMLTDGTVVVFLFPHSLNFHPHGADKITVDLDNGTEWMLRFVKIMTSTDYKPLDLKQLSKKLKIPLMNLKTSVRILSKMGVLTVFRKVESGKRKAA